METVSAGRPAPLAQAFGFKENAQYPMKCAKMESDKYTLTEYTSLVTFCMKFYEPAFIIDFGVLFR